VLCHAPDDSWRPIEIRHSADCCKILHFTYKINGLIERKFIDIVNVLQKLQLVYEILISNTDIIHWPPHDLGIIDPKMTGVYGNTMRAYLII
jgi:hypothetical protein